MTPNVVKVSLKVNVYLQYNTEVSIIDWVCDVYVRRWIERCILHQVPNLQIIIDTRRLNFSHVIYMRYVLKLKRILPHLCYCMHPYPFLYSVMWVPNPIDAHHVHGRVHFVVVLVIQVNDDGYAPVACACDQVSNLERMLGCVLE